MNRSQTIDAIFQTLDAYKRLLHAQFGPQMTKVQLSPSQIQLLLTLVHHQPLSHKELAKRMQLTPGAISQLLDGLDASGCIVRSPSPTDRRISYLSVSRVGKKKVEQLHELRKKIFVGAFEALNNEELEAYLHAQQKILAWLEERTTTNKKEY